MELLFLLLLLLCRLVNVPLGSRYAIVDGMESIGIATAIAIITALGSS